MTSKNPRKPLLCRLGLHFWSIDAALFSSAYICNRCGKPQSDFALSRLTLERELWQEVSELRPNASWEDKCSYVNVHLFGFSTGDYQPRLIRPEHAADLRSPRGDEAVDTDEQNRRRALGE